MLPRSYAIAVKDMLRDGRSFPEVLASLDEVLKSRGHIKLKSAVLRELLRLFEGDQAERVEMILAKEGDAKALEGAIKDSLKALNVKDVSRTSIDDSLIGGYILKNSGHQIDKSYKRALIDLYQKTIASV